MAVSSRPGLSSSQRCRTLQHSATAFNSPSTSSTKEYAAHNPHIALYESTDGRTRVVARVSGRNVAVLDHTASIPAHTLQGQASASVSCLRITASRQLELHEPSHVLIAASASHQLTIWSSVTPPLSRWTLHSTLSLPPLESITSFDLHQDHVLIGTTNRSLQLWKLDQAGHSHTWQKLWSKICPAPIHDVQWNHDGSDFAAFGRCDTRVLVWRFKRGKVPVRKSILVHHGLVESITWRGPPEATSQTDVLVTRATDGASHIWAPVIDQPDHLRLSATIDGFSFSSSQADSHPVLYLNALHFANVLRTSISLLERDVQMAELAIHDQNSTRFSPDLLRTRLKRLQHLLSDTPDVFVRLVDDGSTVVVRAVANIDRRPPTLLQAYTVLVLRLTQQLVVSTFDHVELIPLYIRPGQSIEEPSAVLHFSTLSGGSVDVELSPALFFDGLEAGFSPRTRGVVRGHSRDVHSLWEYGAGITKHVVSLDSEGAAIEWRMERSSRQKDALVPTRRTDDSPTDVQGGKLFYHAGDVSIWTSSSRQGEILLCFQGKPAQSLQIEKGSAVLAVLHVRQDHEKDVTEVIALTSTGEIAEWQISAAAVTRVPSSTILQIGGSSSLVYAVAVQQPHPQASTDTYHFVTISGEGAIAMWKRSSTRTVTKQYGLSAGKAIDVGVSLCSSQGTLALVTEANKELNIYSLTSSPFEAALQYTFEVPDDEGRIVGLDWLSVSDIYNAELLAVATKHQVRVLSQTRATPDLPDGLWTTVATFDARLFTSTPLTAVRWHSDGALVVCESSNVHLLGPTVEGNVTLLDLARLHQGPLPAYHPTMLRSALLTGRIDAAYRVINDLARAIEEARLEERLVVEASSVRPIALEEIIADEPSSHSNRPGAAGSVHASLFEGGIDSEERSDPLLDDKVVSRALESLDHVQLEGVEGIEARQLKTLMTSLAQTLPQSQTLDTLGYSALLALKQTYADVGASIAASTSLDHRYTVSALHTSNQEYLLDTISAASPLKNGRVPWSLARLSNLFLWAPQSQLASLAEQVARDQFQAGETERDPVSCSLFYYALGNRRLVLNLWRQAAWHPEQKKMITFLEKDFGEQRWRTAACKNAFALLSQRRFEFAASFFMLGDSLQDAINVCVKNLNDVQLAIALARIKEGRDDGPVLQKLIRERVLPLANESQDRYLAHWCLWMIGRKAAALQVLLNPVANVLAPEIPAAISHSTTARPEDLTLATIYRVVRSKLPSSSSIDQQHEWQFLLHTNRVLQRVGCHVFGLSLLSQWQFVSGRDEAVEVDKEQSLPPADASQQPTAGPPEPDLDSLLSLGGGSSVTRTHTPAPPQPAQGVPEPALDDLLNMGGSDTASRPPRQSTNGVENRRREKPPPSQGPPEPSMDELFDMGSDPSKKAESPAAVDSGPSKADEKRKKGLGSLMKPTTDASVQGAQEFDMSNFGF